MHVYMHGNITPLLLLSPPSLFLSHLTTPNAYTSAAGDTWPCLYSSAMNISVPTTVVVMSEVASEGRHLATPKSPSFAVQSEEMRTLALQVSMRCPE